MKWKKIHFPWWWMENNESITQAEYQRRVRLFNEFVDCIGFDTMAWPECIGSYERFLYGKRNYNIVASGYHVDDVPDYDHAIIFKIKGTRDIVYVNQPYSFDLEELEVWCNDRNLIYVTCDKSRSFYIPDDTEMVLIMSHITYIKHVAKFKILCEERRTQ